MSIHLGSTSPSNFYVGNKGILKLMLGTTLMWQLNYRYVLWSGAAEKATSLNFQKQPGYLTVRMTIGNTVAYYYSTMDQANSLGTISLTLIKSISGSNSTNLKFSITKSLSGYLVLSLASVLPNEEKYEVTGVYQTSYIPSTAL